MMYRLKMTLAAAATVVFAAFPSLAATVTSNNLDNAALSALAGSSTALPGGGSWQAGPAPQEVAGNEAGQYRSPFEDLGVGNFESIAYWNVLGGQTGMLVLNSLRTSLSFLWGSVDTYNTVTLFNSVAGTSMTFDNTDLGNPDAPTLGLSASFVTITGFTFDRVAFGGTGNSMEFSNVSAVPLPAGGLLLIGALGGLALLRRRKTA